MLYAIIVNFVLLLSTVMFIIYFYIKWNLKHWERKGIPFIPPRIPTGNIQVFKVTESFSDQIKKIYEYARAMDYKYIGIYFLWRPILLVLDPELIKSVMAKDFQYFSNRGNYYNEEDDPLSAHLFTLETKKWKPLRAKLTPTFSSGKMKAMLEIVIKCGDQLKDFMDHLSDSPNPIDIKGVLGRYTLNVIGSCAFGLDCNCFETKDSDFIKYSKKFFVKTRLEGIKTLITLVQPKLAKFFKFKVIHEEVSKFFMRIVRETIEYREKNNVIRNDFLHLLIDLKNGKSVTDEMKIDASNRLTIEEVCAQAFVFFLAGYETSSTTMSFCLYELAVNPKYQDIVRNEVEEVLKRYDNKITYEGLAEMKYMSQVVDETFRKYPPAPTLNRECVADYKLPGTDIVLEKGTMVFIPDEAIQNDSKYFEDAEKFDPERFSDENKHTITPFTYLPFGDGPRNCVGLRFGIMQMKVGLAVLLKNYEFFLNDKTKTPFKMHPECLILHVLGDIWLNVKKVN